MINLHARILDRLEALEDSLLCWGVVDGGFSEEELRAYIGQEVMASGSFEDTDDVIEAMTEQALLVQDHTFTPSRWRTRNGETIRLLARLRQIMLSDSWQSGVNLVSDFRYSRRPRAYPIRNQSWSNVLDDVEGITDIHRAVIDVMTRTGSGHFQLSGFQVRAARQTLTALNTAVTSAIVVGAGTGSGKTLAFYLPAFSFLAALEDSSKWTRALAVYPRTELLKDQLDTAFANARRLDPLWQSTSGRPMTIGALYASTPQNAGTLKGPYGGWPKRATGYASPQLRCPGDGFVRCGGELIWSFDDLATKTERLVCSTCQRTFDDTTIVLTRDRMRHSPPDVLFVTTEMLNRGLSELQLRKTFGVGVSKKPRLMLLDEIHTYDGTTGAQAAMVLRRWHHSLQGPVTFVGLSATLSNPIRHMADLTGVDDALVTSITADSNELEFEGAEYLVALRSDPTSGASVLSTTIQSSMLLPRTQDAPASRVSEGMYGTKAFVFTDDLDVTNRLFGYLLDAEGQRYSNGRTQHTKRPLATTRVTSADPHDQRRAGQSWDLPNAIGHKFAGMGDGLNVSRTTSQDAGVDTSSQLIVATASLEVGFDDPDVGVVIQHKAPRGVAAFLQRKGRAGRQRGMRPYTAVILSDYGRDRATYEAWDTLFDPVLPELVLPIRNRAVVRMQAAISLIDWLVGQLALQDVPPTTKGWAALAKPSSKTFAPGRETQTKAAAILRSLTRDPARQRDLREWVQAALHISDREVNEVLWHPPRPVLLAAVPTLVRRLESEWAVATESGLQSLRDTMGDNPLPDFFPMNLFSELALPETYVSIPPQTARQTEPELEPMPMGQMLREFAPGRVSRRFATRNLDHRHWIPIPVGDRDAVVDLATTLLAYQHEEDCTVEIDGAPTRVSVVRPDQVKLELPPDDIKDASNATMSWASQFVENGSGLALRVPVADPVGRRLLDARFYLHAQNSHLSAHRVATSSEATVMVKGSPGQPDAERQVRTTFTLDGKAVCLGATYDVDGLRLTFNLPADITPPDAVIPGLRSAWFRHVLTSDPLLLERVNSFQVGWFHEALECMLLMRAVTDQCSLSEAYHRVKGSLDAHLDQTLEALFRSPGVSGESDQSTVSRMGKRLKSVLQDPAVVARLDVLSEQWWAPDQARFDAWLHQRTLSTLGLAALAAARQICPEHDPEGVVVDIEPGVDIEGASRSGQVWLSEASVGGGGFIEALAARVRPDPRRFLRLVLRAVQPSMNELVDVHLRRIVHLITSDEEWRTLVNSYRSATTQADRIESLDGVRDAMRHTGIYGSEQSVLSSLANRVLRPGSIKSTDDALRTLIDTWATEEHRIGVEIPPRTWAYLMRDRSDLDGGLVLGAGSSERQRMDAIQSVLWPRGWRLRAEELQSWNPYAENLPAAPDLLRAIAAVSDPQIDLGTPDADARVRALLAKTGSAQVTAAPDLADELANLLVDLSVEPVTTDYLQVYPRVVEIEHLSDGSVVVSLELAEVSV